MATKELFFSATSAYNPSQALNTSGEPMTQIDELKPVLRVLAIAFGAAFVVMQFLDSPKFWAPPERAPQAIRPPPSKPTTFVARKADLTVQIIPDRACGIYELASLTDEYRAASVTRPWGTHRACYVEFDDDVYVSTDYGREYKLRKADFTLDP